MFGNVCHVIEIGLLIVLIWRPLRLKMAHDIEQVVPSTGVPSSHPATQILLFAAGMKLVAEQTVHMAHRPLEVTFGGKRYMSSGRYDYTRQGWIYTETK